MKNANLDPKWRMEHPTKDAFYAEGTMKAIGRLIAFLNAMEDSSIGGHMPDWKAVSVDPGSINRTFYNAYAADAITAFLTEAGFLDLDIPV